MADADPTRDRTLGVVAGADCAPMSPAPAPSLRSRRRGAGSTPRAARRVPSETPRPVPSQTAQAFAAHPRVTGAAAAAASMSRAELTGSHTSFPGIGTGRILKESAHALPIPGVRRLESGVYAGDYQNFAECRS